MSILVAPKHHALLLTRQIAAATTEAAQVEETPKPKSARTPKSSSKRKGMNHSGLLTWITPF